MKILKITIIIACVFFNYSCGNTNKLFSDANEILKTINAGITEEEAASGLKEALNSGVSTGTDFLSKRDGFLKNDMYKILFPPEAQKIEQTLRNLGFGNKCDQVIENINRGAEMAVAVAKPVFINSIKQMKIKDAIKIVTGGNGAATSFLKRTTTSELTNKFKPIIQTSLDKTQATKYWTDIMTIYNKIPGVEKINPDLNSYVTQKALSALFSQIETEENNIRKDPLKRSTQLLKKVFGYADQKKNN
ncbi:MAG: DUF4197 domain-containing protein [Bacteroidetes bacterium]|nr:DUF4197 domain-containing protein [Bacteroidota bacterium]